jgi:hypothetical protein
MSLRDRGGDPVHLLRLLALVEDSERGQLQAESLAAHGPTLGPVDGDQIAGLLRFDNGRGRLVEAVESLGIVHQRPAIEHVLHRRRPARRVGRRGAGQQKHRRKGINDRKSCRFLNSHDRRLCNPRRNIRSARLQTCNL